MPLSLLSLIFSNGSVGSVDKVRLALETNSAFWFRLLKYSGYAVAFGCVLEAPETFVIIKRWWLLRFRGEEHEETQGQKKSWIIPLAAVGLILIVLGIVAETYFEGKVSDVDALLRAHESDKITAAEKDAASAIRDAGTAKDSAVEAEQAADGANAIADAAEKKATAAGIKTDQLGAETEPRKLAPDQENKIGSACLTGYSFAFMKRINIESYGMDAEGTALAKQISEALVSGRIYVTNDFGAFIQTGGVDTGILISGPPEHIRFMNCLASAFTNIGKLAGVTVNGEHHVGNAKASGSVVFSGSGRLSGGGSVAPPGALSASSPITILVAQKPPAPPTRRR